MKMGQGQQVTANSISEREVPSVQAAGGGISKRRQGYKVRRKEMIELMTKDMSEEEGLEGVEKAIKDGVMRRLTEASNSPLSQEIIIDLSYSHHNMTLLEIKSLAAQISHTVAGLRRVEN
jgi:hypothetical protein